MRRQMASHSDFRSTLIPIPATADPARPPGDDRPARPRRDPGAAELVASRRRLPQAAALLATRSVMLAVVAATPLALWPAAARALTPHEALELLGKNAFYDKSLSTPGNKQGCVSCHEPTKGRIFPDAAVNKKTVVAPGAAPHRLGSLKPPSNIYALQPTFQDPLPALDPASPVGVAAPSGMAEPRGAERSQGPQGLAPCPCRGYGVLKRARPCSRPICPRPDAEA